MNTPAFNILAVVQAGRLQYEALLLAASLRASNPNFAGKLRLASCGQFRYSSPPLTVRRWKGRAQGGRASRGANTSNLHFQLVTSLRGRCAQRTKNL